MNRLAPPLREVGIEYNADAGREGSESRKIKSLKKIGFEAEQDGDPSNDQLTAEGAPSLYGEGRKVANPFNFDPPEPDDVKPDEQDQDEG